MAEVSASPERGKSFQGTGLPIGQGFDKINDPASNGVAVDANSDQAIEVVREVGNRKLLLQFRRAALLVSSRESGQGSEA
jgi:hypothetical protein